MATIRRRVINIAELARHAKRVSRKTIGTHSRLPITPTGRRKSVVQGKRYPKGYKIKFYVSEVPRTRQTARAIQRGVKSKGSSTYKGIRKRWQVGFWRLKNPKALREFARQLGLNEAGLYKLWIEHRVPEYLMVSPEETANVAIRKAFWIGKNPKRVKGVMTVTISHDWTVAAVFERLTGQPVKKIPDYNERIRVYFTEDNQAILEFRKKRWNVTQTLNEILKSYSQK